MDWQVDKRFSSKKDAQSYAQLYFCGNKSLARNGALLWLYKKGLVKRQLCDIFSMSKTGLELALIEAQNREFITKGRLCFDCGKEVTIVYYRENPMIAQCKRGHGCTVVYNTDKKVFEVV